MAYRGVTTTTDEQAAKRPGRDEAASTRPAPSHPLVSLQSHVGNRQVARMLAQREAMPEEEELQTKRDPALAQREGELDEEEELQAKHDAALAQREGEIEEEEELQMKHDAPAAPVGLEGGPVGEDIERAIDAARGTGSTLSPGVQSKMEGAIGADFSGVRVHHDDTSDSLARGMTAKAFTTGSDIFLRRDQNPNDHSLLAHELTHVVQQSSGAAGGPSGMTVGSADHPDEHEADAVAAAVTSGRRLSGALEETRA
jgi:hypothetical protein